MTGRWVTRLTTLAAAWFTPTATTTGNPYMSAAAAARMERERELAELAELERQAAARPRREYTRYASGRPHPSGLTDDLAAIAAVRARGLPCNEPATALEERLSLHHIVNAAYLLRHATTAADVLELVETGRLKLWYAALVCRLRERGHTDLAARAERYLPDLDRTRPYDSRYGRAFHAMGRISEQSSKRLRRAQERAQARKDSAA